MHVRFWGVRGSIPCPGPNTWKYGGNTPCIELRFRDPDRLIIIDAGSGIRELGNHLMTHDLPGGPIRTEIFLTHTHWDHIMGFPFFTPIFVPGTEIKLYGPVTYEDDTLESIVGGQLSYRYFPVRDAELASDIEYISLTEGSFDLGDGIRLTTKYLNHPLLCLGYRFDYRGVSFSTAYDTEPFQNIFCTDPEDPSYDPSVAEQGAQAARQGNDLLEEFFAGADLLVYDAQYSQEEYETSKIGWGHSSVTYCLAAAKRAGVKRLALFHHDPLRTDEELDRWSRDFCHPDRTEGMEVFFAREGTQIEL